MKIERKTIDKIEANILKCKDLFQAYKRTHGSDRKFEICQVGIQLGVFIPLDVEYVLDDEMSESEAEHYFRLAKDREGKRRAI